MNKKLTLDGIFGSGMVLQRERQTSIWGRCAQGAAVSAMLDGEPCCVVCVDGRFTIKLAPQQASRNHTIIIESENERITLEDVCFGDVFLLSGQSNMQLPVSRVQDVSAKETEEADYPLIRHFVVEPRYFFGRQAEEIAPNPWTKGVYPEVMSMSAAGFFFARRMYETLQVPIGLVLNAMGGSTIEAWMSEKLLGELGISTEVIRPFCDHKVFEDTISGEEKLFADWLEALHTDDEEKQACAIPEDAEPFRVPSMSFDTALEDYTGSVWFYREVELESAPEGEGLVYLGDIIDSDRTYINGTLVGETAYRYPPRKYPLPAGLLRKGKNLIACRMVINGTAGGFVPDHYYYLDTGTERMDISGEWMMKKQTEAAGSANVVLFPPILPTGLFNASLYPLKGIEFAGALWYQGESNADAPEGYSDKFTAMMNEWRAHLGQKLPVVCVELCDYVDPAVRVCDQSGWKEIQRQQREQPAHTPDCAVALASDLGESLELHPQRKQELGERLAKEMLCMVYGIK